MSWKFHIGNKNNIGYDMILGRYIITALVLDLKFSKNIITDGEGQYEGSLAPVVDLSNYDFK